MLASLAAAPAAMAVGHSFAADKGGAAAKVDPKAPVFIKMQPLNVTVFDRGAARGKLTIELQIDVLTKARAAAIESRLPRLYDGFLAAVTEYTNSRGSADRGAPDLDYLLARFQSITDESTGGAGVAKVLIHSAIRTL